MSGHTPESAAAGGQAVLEKYGREHYQALGRLGGRPPRPRYGAPAARAKDARGRFLPKPTRMDVAASTTQDVITLLLEMEALIPYVPGRFPQLKRLLTTLREGVIVPRGLLETLKNAELAIAHAEKRVAKLEEIASRPRRIIPQEMRVQVLERDAHRCRYCGVAVEITWAQLDHYEPRGPNTAANLVTSCPPCNRKKRDVRPRDLAKIKGMALQGKSVERPPKDWGNSPAESVS